MTLRFMSRMALSVISVAAWGQTPHRPPEGIFAPGLRSPEVSAGGGVTFRLRAPNAREVLVALAERLPMQKDAEGVWSLTTGPLPPDFYPYSFVVDGVTIADPSNPLLKTTVMGGSQSIVHVPGPSSLSWEMNPVPHGAVIHHFFHSEVTGDDRDFWVYTPPGYDPESRTEYPVLYLLHGLSDDASAWTTAGRANVILDNLIAQGKAQPMIMVNPLGYGVPHPEAGLAPILNNAEQNREGFSKSLLTEIIPMVEKMYRVAKDRNARAIAGLSMGGEQALTIGLNHADEFAYIAGLSSALVMLNRGPLNPGALAAVDRALLPKAFPAVDVKLNPRLRLLYIACGTGDTLVGVNRQFKDWLKSKDVRFQDVETPGAHTWMVWRRNLTEFAPLLFQAKK